MEFLKSIDYTDPFTIVIYAPIILAVAYLIFTMWGRSND